MIIRARPKYLKKEFFEYSNVYKEILGYFFNTGRAALRFLLSNLKTFYKLKQPTILIQDFNCQVVLEAALRSEWQPLLIDISDRGDFSISIASIKSLEITPNAILLTHYQGIPNFNYREIAEFCKKNKIILIDDIAQTYMSTIDNVVIGDLSNFSIESYSFDKPITSWKGGKINCINTEDKFKNFLKNQYDSIPQEEDKTAKQDIQYLKKIWSRTKSSDCTEVEMNYMRYRFFLERIPSIKTLNFLYEIKALDLYLFLENRMSKLLNYGRDIDYTPQKLNNYKIDIIEKQKASYKYDPKEVLALERLLKDSGIDILTYPPDININWNRYSILDPDGTIKKIIYNLNIQALNYNWPKPLSDLYKDNKKVIKLSNSFHNSQYASENIVNIPVWSKFFQSLNE
mgnify:CR=1 FL=1